MTSSNTTYTSYEWMMEWMRKNCSNLVQIMSNIIHLREHHCALCISSIEQYRYQSLPSISYCIYLMKKINEIKLKHSFFSLLYESQTGQNVMIRCRRYWWQFYVDDLWANMLMWIENASRHFYSLNLSSTVCFININVANFHYLPRVVLSQ